MIFILKCSHVFGQSIESLSQPDIINHAHQSYKAHRQNWDIAQNPVNNFMYFANSKGLLEYDGTQWTTFELPAKQIVRSVFCDQKGLVWTGALGEFGYWQKNDLGLLVYHSLKEKIQDRYFNQEEIWHILETPNGILFQSFAYIYLYKNGKIEKLKNPGNVLYVFEANNRYILEVLDKGLYELKNEKFEFIPESEFLKNESVHSIIAGPNSSILIGTNRGIYKYDGTSFSLFNLKTQQYLRQNQLNAGIRLGNGNYIFGTILNGLILTDTTGNIITLINQKNGLQNNTVLSLKNDRVGNVWIGLDNGISMLAMSSPFKYFEEGDGELGTVFDAAVFQNRLYLATNHGVFYNQLTKPNQKFQLIPNTQSQTWDLEVIDNQLFCGHNNGTFRIDGLGITAISTVTGGLVIKKLKQFPEHLIQGTYTRPCIYKKDPKGNWTFSHTIDNFSAPIKQIEEGQNGEIFVNTLNNGVFRILLSKDLKKAEKIIPVKLNYVPKNLSKINQKIVLTTESDVLEYNNQNQQFEVRKDLVGLGNIHKIFEIKDEQWYLRSDGTFGKINSQKKWLELPLKKDSWVTGYENLLFLDSTFFLCKENGFVTLNEKSIDKLLGQNGTKPIIKSMVVGTFSTYNLSDQLPFDLKYNQNSLKFTFSSPDYSTSIKFSYWLENYMAGWSEFSENFEKEFNNLPPGEYILHLKTNTNSETTRFKFAINDPWYWNIWSKMLFIILIISAFSYLYKLHNKRLEQQNQKLIKEKEEELNAQIEHNRQEIIRLRNEQLEKDVVRKSEELANSTMQLIKKNELLKKLKFESQQIDNQSKVGNYNLIVKLIDSNISSGQDWKVFEQNFNRVHEAFFKKLLEIYPDLSSGDLKLSAYLRMNLSSKEIAQLLNITSRSVELKRYRLRKKMNLSTEENLVEWFMSSF
ncbi:MAG: triple tyrosine motif-containing protein [Bacteroidota bacterium]